MHAVPGVLKTCHGSECRRFASRQRRLLNHSTQDICQVLVVVIVAVRFGHVVRVHNPT